MDARCLIIAVPLFVGIAFVPAFPVMWLGDTSWSPVWMVYPSVFAYLREASSYGRELLIYAGFIVVHLGLSLAGGVGIGMLLPRARD